MERNPKLQQQQNSNMDKVSTFLSTLFPTTGISHKKQGKSKAGLFLSGSNNNNNGNIDQMVPLTQVKVTGKIIDQCAQVEVRLLLIDR